MNRSRHELFSNPCFAADQHSKTGRCHELDLLTDPLNWTARTYDLVAALAHGSISLQNVRDLLVMPGRGHERFDEMSRVESSTRERAEHLQEPIIEVVESARFQCVRRQHSDHALAFHQRTSEARVHVARGIRVHKQ